MKNRMTSFCGESLYEVTKRADEFLQTTDGELNHILYQHQSIGDFIDFTDLFSLVVVFTPKEKENEKTK